MTIRQLDRMEANALALRNMADNQLAEVRKLRKQASGTQLVKKKKINKAAKAAQLKATIEAVIMK